MVLQSKEQSFPRRDSSRLEETHGVLPAMFLGWWDLRVVWCLGPKDRPGCRGESTENTLSPRDPEFVFYDQLKQVMNAYR